MQNKLSHFQLARVIAEDLAGFLSTGTTLTRHAQLALLIAANQVTAEKQLSEFLIGESTPEADAVAQAWSILSAGLGLIQAAAIVDAAGAVLDAWEERERRRPEWLQTALISTAVRESEALEHSTTSQPGGGGESDENGRLGGSGFLS